MPITLGSNIASLTAQRQLDSVSQGLSKTYERLSSGLRINRASDDAAGLAVSTCLNSNVRVFTQGIRNLSDGVSLLNIADGAVAELANIVIRIQELAEQSANGTYNSPQRGALDTEAQALSDEYTRIIQTTTFNNINLFDDSNALTRIQCGYGEAGSIKIGGTLESELAAPQTISTTTTVGTGSFDAAQSYS